MIEVYSWKSVRALFGKHKVALVPVGSTEQHGPHLPLGTDFLTAQALAQAAARKTGAICTPVIPVGVSAHHRQFWGTIWVNPSIFREYMQDIALSLAFHGIRRVIFVNGHGGNFAPLQEICLGLHQQGSLYATVYQWWTDPSLVELCDKLFKSKGTHAGAIETSMMLAIQPKLVDRGSYDEAAKGAAPTFGILKHGSELPVDTLDFSDSGATLDPREASLKAGKQIFNAAKKKLVDLVEWLEKAKDADLKAKPHKR